MKHHKPYFLAGVLLTIATVLAFAPDAWVPMMARSFMLQWMILFSSIAMYMALKRQWVLVGSALSCTLITAPQLERPVIATHDQATASDLRLLHMNVLQPNRRAAAVIRQALNSDADIISVQEVDHYWAEELREHLGGAYPYHVIEPRTNCYGIALFSRVPLKELAIREYQGAPFAEAVLRLHGREITLLAVHTTSPGSYGHFRKRNTQLDELSATLRQRRSPAIVIGDLNTVHWDDAYKSFCRRTGLRPVNDTGNRTWPALGPLALIPLDHVLLSEEFGFTRFGTFDVPGSDHRGLVVDIVLRLRTDHTLEIPADA